MTRRDAHKGKDASAWIRCAKTGKRGYESRSLARKARGRTRGVADPDKVGGLSIYRCEDDARGAGCGLFHLGHLPRPIVEGDLERSALRKPRDTPSG